MKIRTVFIVLGLAGIVASCIPSLYPLYRLSDLVIDDRLEGLYETGENESWKIRRLDPDSEDLQGGWERYHSGYTYRLSVREEDNVEEFALHMLTLGDDVYLDFFPVDYHIRHAFLDMHLVPTHIFAKAEVTDDALILHFFDMEWLEDLIKSKKIKISHVETRDRYVLTAKTEELQKFITKFANDSTTFFEVDTLPRQPFSSRTGDFSTLLNVN
jgi:hypothetical protein